MSTLRANIQLLNEATDLFALAYDQCDKLSEEVNKIANEIKTIWDGAACDEYVRRLYEQAGTIQDTKKVLKELKKFTKESSEDLQEKDRRLRAQLAILEKVGVLSALDKMGVLDNLGIVKVSGSGRIHGGGGRKF